MALKVVNREKVNKSVKTKRINKKQKSQKKNYKSNTQWERTGNASNEPHSSSRMSLMNNNEGKCIPKQSKSLLSVLLTIN